MTAGVATAQLRGRVADYLSTAPPRGLTQHQAAARLGISQSRISAVLLGQWHEMWRAELERRFAVGVQELGDHHFTSQARAAADIARAGNLTPSQVRHWFGPRLAELCPAPLGPDGRRQLLTRAMESLAATIETREAFTWELVEATAGTTIPHDGHELRRQFRRLRGALPRRDRTPDEHVIAIGTKPRRLLRRSALRPDIADLVWEVLRSEVGRVDRAPSGVVRRYAGFRLAGRVLGNAIPSVHDLTLNRLQAAWFQTELTRNGQRHARIGLLGLCDLLVARSAESGGLDAVEFARCSEWLESVAVRPRTRAQAALSAEQSDVLVTRCTTVIEDGRARLRADPDLLSASTNPRAMGSAAAVVDWGLALALLVGRFTGLRADSIATLRASELGEIGHETFALVWRHGKKAEERLAIVPASLAHLLREYERALSPVRLSLETDRLFLLRSPDGQWEAAAGIGIALRAFTRRHLPDFGGMTVALLRRTFATRSLAEGRSLAAIAAQLGHQHLATTIRYAQFERSEHALETRAALDRYGRVVLERWRTPVLMSELSPAEQRVLADDAQARHCEVGLCRPGTCLMLSAGAPPPCLACRHLVTGPAFFPAWEADLAARRLRVEKLSAPGSEMLTAAANEAVQLAEVERIYAELQARATP